jgi:hypothetical protein
MQSPFTNPFPAQCLRILSRDHGHPHGLLAQALLEILPRYTVRVELHIPRRELTLPRGSALKSEPIDYSFDASEMNIELLELVFAVTSTWLTLEVELALAGPDADLALRALAQRFAPQELLGEQYRMEPMPGPAEQPAP